jgi:hypothetical protein
MVVMMNLLVIIRIGRSDRACNPTPRGACRAACGRASLHLVREDIADGEEDGDQTTSINNVHPSLTATNEPRQDTTPQDAVLFQLNCGV